MREWCLVAGCQGKTEHPSGVCANHQKLTAMPQTYGIKMRTTGDFCLSPKIMLVTADDEDTAWARAKRLALSLKLDVICEQANGPLEVIDLREI
jgi:hypothetical protein